MGGWRGGTAGGVGGWKGGPVGVGGGKTNLDTLFGVAI